MLLNPQIPLEIFLPPDDFNRVYFLGTHDDDGFSTGVFFLRVHEWSVRMLIEALSIRKIEFGDSPNKGQRALDEALRSDQFRDHVLYQPRSWYNAYSLGANEFEGKPGDLLVHFHGLAGDKWSAMADTVNNTSELRRTWSVALEQTSYRKEVDEYWNRIRTAYDTLRRAEPHRFNPTVDGPFRRLEYASTYEVDDAEAMNLATEKLKEVAGL